MPIFDPDGKCPLLNKKCIKHQCVWYNMLQGKNPQTGLDVQEWGCSIAWIPLLLIENSQQIMGKKAATESFRNEMVQSNNIMTIFEVIGNHQKAIDTNDKSLEEETIRQLSNNKVKVKKGKKVKKDGNNRKQHNSK